jgi:hypothetical protein
VLAAWGVAEEVLLAEPQAATRERAARPPAILLDLPDLRLNTADCSFEKRTSGTSQSARN